MDALASYSEGFKLLYEKFLIGCDSLEEFKEWDLESNGEMDVYYTNDLVSVIIHLIAADGVFTEKETAYLNEVFGFRYTAEALREIYEDCGNAMETLFEQDIPADISRLHSINEKLAQVYRELLAMVCDIVIASDGVVQSAEVDLAKRLQSMVTGQ